MNVIGFDFKQLDERYDYFSKLINRLANFFILVIVFFYVYSGILEFLCVLVVQTQSIVVQTQSIVVQLVRS